MNDKQAEQLLILLENYLYDYNEDSSMSIDELMEDLKTSPPDRIDPRL